MLKIVISILLLTSLLFAQDAQIHGAFKSIMHGDLRANFGLMELEGKNNIYGLGAVENLKGEIIVINSKPYISWVEGQSIIIDSTFNHNAALFAFSSVANWKTDSIAGPLNLIELEKLITEKVQKKTEAVTFLIEGLVKSLNWHVIDWADGDTVHTHQKHKTAGLDGETKNEQVTIAGFYSTNQKGVLTHRNSNLHLHFITKDKNLAGHVDDIILTSGILMVTDNSL